MYNRGGLLHPGLHAPAPPHKFEISTYVTQWPRNLKAFLAMKVVSYDVRIRQPQMDGVSRRQRRRYAPPSQNITLSQYYRDGFDF